MRHVVLCGDSIFDNAAYVEGGPDVAQQLRGTLDSGDKVTLLAVDGSISSQVVGQFEKLPVDATHLVVSTGGNDILHYAAMLEQNVHTVAAAMAMLAAAKAEFAPHHMAAVNAAYNVGLPTAFCTIYDANMGPAITTALGVFNDAITRHLHQFGLDLIDLRLVCTKSADYANPIEPSVAGGAKIAAAVARYAQAVTKRSEATRVFR
ncbi:GDSL-type esterase/lipase family protein [Parerythrobacter aurantius]|uniref:GDSL-type esterase/lipase family protein n=1 Tax=Parerythrobacter aurantius TaxID=3127706 RepID=UPI00324B20C9